MLVVSCTTCCRMLVRTGEAGAFPIYDPHDPLVMFTTISSSQLMSRAVERTSGRNVFQEEPLEYLSLLVSATRTELETYL